MGGAEEDNQIPKFLNENFKQIFSPKNILLEQIIGNFTCFWKLLVLIKYIILSKKLNIL